LIEEFLKIPNLQTLELGLSKNDILDENINFNEQNYKSLLSFEIIVNNEISLKILSKMMSLMSNLKEFCFTSYQKNTDIDD